MLKPNGHARGNSEKSESITFRMTKPILDIDTTWSINCLTIWHMAVYKSF
jgi:hypothetical protein